MRGFASLPSTLSKAPSPSVFAASISACDRGLGCFEVLGLAGAQAVSAARLAINTKYCCTHWLSSRFIADVRRHHVTSRHRATCRRDCWMSARSSHLGAAKGARRARTRPDRRTPIPRRSCCRDRRCRGWTRRPGRASTRHPCRGCRRCCRPGRACRRSDRASMRRPCRASRRCCPPCRADCPAPSRDICWRPCSARPRYCSRACVACWLAPLPNFCCVAESL